MEPFLVDYSHQFVRENWGLIVLCALGIVALVVAIGTVGIRKKGGK